MPLYRERQGESGIFTIPLFARAGAIIRQMYVDEHTRTISGRRDVNLATLSVEARQREVMLANELSVMVVAGTAPTSFTLYEDDGITTDYLKGNVRETRIIQQAEADQVRVTIDKARVSFTAQILHGLVS